MKYPDVKCPKCGAPCSCLGSNAYIRSFQCKGAEKHKHTIKRERDFYQPPAVKNPVPRREPRPFVELRRDPFEFMKLALSIKRP